VQRPVFQLRVLIIKFSQQILRVYKMSFPPKQKFTLKVDSVSLLATANQIKQGISPEYSVNAATQKALLVLETMRQEASQAGKALAMGLTGRWDGIKVEINLAN
jgi:hypothetical protein